MIKGVTVMVTAGPVKPLRVGSIPASPTKQFCFINPVTKVNI